MEKKTWCSIIRESLFMSLSLYKSKTWMQHYLQALEINLALGRPWIWRSVIIHNGGRLSWYVNELLDSFNGDNIVWQVVKPSSPKYLGSCQAKSIRKRQSHKACTQQESYQELLVSVIFCFCFKHLQKYTIFSFRSFLTFLLYSLKNLFVGIDPYNKD